MKSCNIWLSVALWTVISQVYVFTASRQLHKFDSKLVTQIKPDSARLKCGWKNKIPFLFLCWVRCFKERIFHYQFWNNLYIQGSSGGPVMKYCNIKSHSVSLLSPLQTLRYPIRCLISHAIREVKTKKFLNQTPFSLS